MTNLSYYLFLLIAWLSPWLLHSDYPHTMLWTLQHAEGSGIGYSQGYSTLSVFTPLVSWTQGSLYNDTRVHVLDNGKIAANIGFIYSLQKKPSGSYFGCNIYYDLRQKHYLFNQLGLGLEYRNQYITCNLNGYIPMGPKIRSWNMATTTYPGNYYVAQDHYFNSFNWTNFMLRWRVTAQPHMEFYLGAGPYVLKARGGYPSSCVWGGQGMITWVLNRVIVLEGTISHDSIFHTRYQGQISLRLTKQAPSQLFLPIRQEILPLKKGTRWRWNY